MCNIKEIAVPFRLIGIFKNVLEFKTAYQRLFNPFVLNVTSMFNRNFNFFFRIQNFISVKRKQNFDCPSTITS